MMQKFLLTRRSMLYSLVGMLLTAMLTLWGCGSNGSGSYTDPSNKAEVTTTVTKSGNALVEADELKQWMDEGKVNAPLGSYDRVVILTVDSLTNYQTGHIPGSVHVDGSGAFMDNNRAEGPFNTTGAMVCKGKQIDALIQAAGIDGNTTIVLTNSANTINMTRAYATLRYWGFAKNRIKVLQGGNAAWTTAGYEMTKATPTVTASTYSVAPGTFTRINTDMRVSLAEMIAYVQGIVAGNADNVTIVDNIRPATHITNTTDLIDSGNTPMEGAIKGSYRYPYGGFVDTTIGPLYFKDADTIKAELSATEAFDKSTMGDAKRDATKVFIAQCRAGNAASVGYFALDGIAYYNSPNVQVKWYDGSYGQWNLLVGKDKTGVNGANAGGQLAVGSIWETTSLMDNLTYTVDKSPVVAVVKYSSRVYGIEPSFANGNQIEDEDRAYRSAPTGSAGDGSAGGGGGGC